MAGIKLTPIILKQVNKYLTTPKKVRKFGFDDTPVKTGKDIERPQEALDREMFKDAEERFNKADGGRIGFYKAGLVTKGPNQGKYSVKFPTNTALDAKYKGTKYGTKTEIENLIKERDKVAKASYKAGVAKSANITKSKKDKELKKLIDEVFETRDFENFKSKPTDAQIRFAEKTGKTRAGTGKVPAQYIKQIKKAVEKGVESDEFKNIVKITNRTPEEILELHNKAPMGEVLTKVRGKAAAISSAKLDPINKKLSDLIKNNVFDKEKIKKTLDISEDKFQKSISLLFKQSYDNRSQINKGKIITSYLGNTSDEITNFLQNLKKVDGVDQVTQRRNITQILDDLFGKQGTMPNPKAYDTMMKRVDEFYKLRDLLPKNIKLNLDHPIPEILIQQLEKSGPTSLRANVQPITQALNMGLKNKIDIAYANAYDLASKGNVNAKKIMGAIDEVAEKIDLPLGKVTNQYVDFGKNPFLRGDLKKVIIDNLKAQNLIVSKFESLDPNLKKRAGLDRLKNINIPQINIKEVEQAFGISNQGGFVDKQFLADVGKFAGRAAQAAFVTPTGVAASTLGLGGLDLTSPVGRLTLGAELAAAPELVRASIGATRGMKNRALQKGIQQFLNLGLPTRLALKAARVASPIGIASLAGEGLYQAGKFAKKRMDELQAMSPEQRQALRARQAAFAFEGAREGGIIGKKSGPPPVSGPMPHGLPYETKGVKKQ
jgi:DNA-binding protein H-NS